MLKLDALQKKKEAVGYSCWYCPALVLQWLQWPKHIKNKIKFIDIYAQVDVTIKIKRKVQNNTFC